ncbi:MAG: signal recognition particle protein [Erysipelotrichia bacterium]|nr:signal recognition particle protein [Erysipelotrichia bacterium]
MAFENLSERFSRLFKKIKGEARLSEKNLNEVLSEIRLALLEADVNYRVVKDFLEQVKTKALGQDVLTKLNPSQTFIKIVHDEIVNLLGNDDNELKFHAKKPSVMMLVGLQGSGKTTSVAKLASFLKTKQNKKVLIAACDTYRPAAVEQLEQLAKKINVDLVFEYENVTPLVIAERALKKAYNDHYDVLLIDTAGRLHIDEDLMDELIELEKICEPIETLLVFDAMSGQDVANVALSFQKTIKITGALMSKTDGDARGGAALSIRHLTNIPIKFTGIGEKINDLDQFYPERSADLILGMGDVVSLVEKVQDEIDEKDMQKTVNKIMSGRFDLTDMLTQMRQVQKLGSLGGLMRLIPGMPKLTSEQQEQAEKEMKLFEAIYNSMTPEERIYPEILRNSRKVRIANGSGTSNADINRVIKKYEKTKEMMQKMGHFTKNNKKPPFGGFPF